MRISCQQIQRGDFSRRDLNLAAARRSPLLHGKNISFPTFEQLFHCSWIAVSQADGSYCKYNRKGWWESGCTCARSPKTSPCTFSQHFYILGLYLHLFMVPYWRLYGKGLSWPQSGQCTSVENGTFILKQWTGCIIWFSDSIVLSHRMVLSATNAFVKT